MDIALSLKNLRNPYIYMIGLGFILIGDGFRFPTYLENRYLNEAESLAKEQSQNRSRRREIFDSKLTEENSRELAELDHDLPRLRKKALEVSALRGELSLRIVLSQIRILIGAIIATLGFSVWFFDWKQRRDRRQVLSSGLSRRA